MSRKGFILSLNILVSFITGLAALWDNPDKVFFTGLVIYYFLSNEAQDLPVKTYWDDAIIRITRMLCISTAFDWFMFDPYNFSPNEYIFFIFIVCYEIYKYRKHKKAPQECRAQK